MKIIFNKKKPEYEARKEYVLKIIYNVHNQNIFASMVCQFNSANF
jgi:hypothetical protein